MQIEDKSLIESRYLELQDNDKFSKNLSNFIIDYKFEVANIKQEPKYTHGASYIQQDNAKYTL